MLFYLTLVTIPHSGDYVEEVCIAFFYPHAKTLVFVEAFENMDEFIWYLIMFGNVP